MVFPHEASGFLKLLKVIVPLSIRQRLRQVHQRIVLDRALSEFSIYYNNLDQHPRLLDDLIYGWGNMGWSSFQDYSKAIVGYALETKGPVLECGSGLSTVMLGIIAQERGFKVYTLEHHAAWAKQVRSHLGRLGLTNVIVCETPLKDYGDYAWYDVSSVRIVDQIPLVICDGPPHDTKKGRYGLLPVMSSVLMDGACILLDDYARKEEQNIVLEWQKHYALSVERRGLNDAYAYIEFRFNA